MTDDPIEQLAADARTDPAVSVASERPDPGPGDRVDDLARRLVLLAALERAVADAKAEAKDELRRLIRPGHTLRPLLGDGRPAGSVSYTIGRPTVAVADEAALAEWVTRRYPTEVELATTVRPAFRKQLLEGALAAGVPIGPGGEVAEDGPPLSIRTGAGYLTAKADPKRATAVWAEIRTAPMELLTTEQDVTE